MAFWRKYKNYDEKQKWFVVNRISCIIVENLESELMRNFSITLDMTITNNLGVKVPLFDYIRAHFTRNFRTILTNEQIKEHFNLSLQILTVLHYSTEENKFKELLRKCTNPKLKTYYEKKINEYNKLSLDLQLHLEHLGYDFNHLPPIINNTPLFDLGEHEYDEI